MHLPLSRNTCSALLLALPFCLLSIISFIFKALLRLFLRDDLLESSLASQSEGSSSSMSWSPNDNVSEIFLLGQSFSAKGNPSISPEPAPCCGLNADSSCQLNVPPPAPSARACRAVINTVRREKTGTFHQSYACLLKGIPCLQCLGLPISQALIGLPFSPSGQLPLDHLLVTHLHPVLTHSLCSMCSLKIFIIFFCGGI